MRIGLATQLWPSRVDPHEPASWAAPTQPRLCDDGEVLATLSTGLADSTVGLCLADQADLIRYANPAYRDAFIPGFDGSPVDFTAAVVSAIKARTGIKLDSTDPDRFQAIVSTRRRLQTGSRSFTADMVDGRWWWVTDTKLSNGWMLAVAQDISGVKQEEFRLRDAHATAVEEAQTDDLTGAPNRRHGLRRAEALCSAARCGGHALSIALIDIDHFKGINDRYGHETGDRALVQFAQWMMGALGPEASFSRIGGDEFLLVLPGGDARHVPREALGAARADAVPGPACSRCSTPHRGERRDRGSPRGWNLGGSDAQGRRGALRRQGCGSGPHHDRPFGLADAPGDRPTAPPIRRARAPPWQGQASQSRPVAFNAWATRSIRPAASKIASATTSVTATALAS